MALINNVYSGNNLKAEDLGGQDRHLIIQAATVEEIDDDGRKKRMIRLTFQNQDQGLLLNVTNANTIGEMYGPDTDYWIGQPITLYPDRVPFGNKIVDAIRIRLNRQEQMPSRCRSRCRSKGSGRSNSRNSRFIRSAAPPGWPTGR